MGLSQREKNMEQKTQEDEVNSPLHFDYHQSFQESLVMIPMESQRLQRQRIRRSRCFSWISYPKFQQVTPVYKATKFLRSCATSFLACLLICFIFIFRTYLSTVHFRFAFCLRLWPDETSEAINS